MIDISRTSELGVVTHYNIRRTIDIFGSVQGSDLGAVGKGINNVVNANRKYLPSDAARFTSHLTTLTSQSA